MLLRFHGVALPCYTEGAFVWGDQACENSYEGGFPCSVRTKESEHHPLLHRKGDTAECGDCPKAFRYCVHLNDCHMFFSRITDMRGDQIDSRIAQSTAMVYARCH